MILNDNWQFLSFCLYLLPCRKGHTPFKNRCSGFSEVPVDHRTPRPNSATQCTAPVPFFSGWNCEMVKSLFTKENCQAVTFHWTDHRLGENNLQIMYVTNRLYPECIRTLKLNSKKTNSPIKTWAKDWNRHFTKEDMCMASKHVNRCFSHQWRGSHVLIFNLITVERWVSSHSSSVEMCG